VEEEANPPRDAMVSFQKAKQGLLEMFERDYLEDALLRSRGNIAEAARASGKARRAFFELMRKHGVRAVSSIPITPPAP
jgi:two-component system response regulator GlrR